MGGDGRGLPPAVCLITFVFGGWGLSIRYEEIATPTHNKTQTMQMTSLASCVCNIEPKYRCAYTSVLVILLLPVQFEKLNAEGGQLIAGTNFVSFLTPDIA